MNIRKTELQKNWTVLFPIRNILISVSKCISPNNYINNLLEDNTFRKCSGKLSDEGKNIIIFFFL